ncbi:MAG: hypothetical protein WD708_01190, partial [Kiritimatiellia bacterium]
GGDKKEMSSFSWILRRAPQAGLALRVTGTGDTSDYSTPKVPAQFSPRSESLKLSEIKENPESGKDYRGGNN